MGQRRNEVEQEGGMALGQTVAFFRYGSVELSTVTSALLLNAILGFILLWIACHAYNWVASR
ncbi:hypothetical protein ACRXB1_34985, partial [Caballeronia sp. M23-90]